LDFDFTQEAIRGFRIGGLRGEHHLHGFLTTGKQIADPVHSAHPALAEYPQDLIIGDRVAWLEMHPVLPYDTILGLGRRGVFARYHAMQMSGSDPRLLNRRTLERDHPRLAQLLRAGMSALDVGCGSGAITAGIAKMVGLGGAVVGLDRDDANLTIARQEHPDIGNLRFEKGDILSFDSERRFDIVTAARTLQWIGEPDRAIVQMKKAVKAGGRIVILDYNLEDTRWEPEPPADFIRFYRAFLDWRTANTWDNRMAEHLPGLLRSAGLNDVEIHRCDETVQRGDPDFFGAYASGIWLYAIHSLGPQLVAAGFIEEQACLGAEEDYRQYVQTALRRQTHSMSTVEGRKWL
jgi:ubiquinone/menaquinone biosynthesis C-methylase UbiE